MTLPLLTSSPLFVQSNGKVENAIKTAKRLLKKSKGQRDFGLVLLDWRNTPTEGLDSSPAQRMFGRRTRTLLPTSNEVLQPKLVETVQKKLVRRAKQRKYYNRGAKLLSGLEEGDVVRVAPRPLDKSKKWIKAKVLSKDRSTSDPMRYKLKMVLPTAGTEDT